MMSVSVNITLSLVEKRCIMQVCADVTVVEVERVGAMLNLVWASGVDADGCPEGEMRDMGECRPGDLLVRTLCGVNAMRRAGWHGSLMITGDDGVALSRGELFQMAEQN